MAEYIKQEMNDLDGSGKRRTFYRMKTYQRINMREFVSELAQPGSGLSEGSVLHVLSNMAEKLAFYMGQGYTVTIDGVGTFKPALGLSQDKETNITDDDNSERNARSIEVNGVNFRASQELIRRTNRHCNLKRGGSNVLHHSRYTEEERLALAQQYLSTHTLMRIADYTQLTGLSRTTATRELQRFRQDPNSGITISGMGTNKVYVKRKNE